VAAVQSARAFVSADAQIAGLARLGHPVPAVRADGIDAADRLSGQVLQPAGRAVVWHQPAGLGVANHDTAEIFFDIHGAILWMLLAWVAIHVGGALKHLTLDKDGIFPRMWFKSAAY
jgi:hypothetical protein